VSAQDNYAASTLVRIRRPEICPACRSLYAGTRLYGEILPRGKKIVTWWVLCPACGWVRWRARLTDC
jgi:hypothetical protein